MPNLPDLPTEILCEIFSSLPTVDLGKLCLASRRFNQIAEPFLYKVADLNRGTVDDMAIPYFLRTVLSRPQLAESVLVLVLTWFSDEQRLVEFNSSDQQNENDISLFTAAAESVGLTGPWSSYQRQMILLLHILPNLEQFFIAHWSPSNIFSDFLESTLDIPAESLPAALKSISSVSSDWRSDQRAGRPVVTPKMLVALMMLPAISAMDVCLECIQEDPDDFGSLNLDSTTQYHGSSSVTRLQFQDSNFSASLLSTVLQFPRALTHFTYEDFHPYNPLFEITTFSQAIAHLRPTLQYLCLGWIRVLQSPHPSVHGEDRKTIGCLRDWPVLRTIKCPLTALVGKPAPVTPRLVDVLPVVIKALHLSRRHTGESARRRMYDQWTVGDMTDKIAELVEDKEVYGLRDLARLTVNTNSIARMHMEWVAVHGRETEARLAAACIAHGVVGLEIEVD